MTKTDRAPFELTFHLDGLPPTQNARLHWRARARENKAWEEAVHYATIGKRPPVPLERALLVLTRISAVPTDADNVVAGFKPVIDGLVKAGILIDDDWSSIGMPEYRWERGPRSGGRIRIFVRELDPELIKFV